MNLITDVLHDKLVSELDMGKNAQTATSLLTSCVRTACSQLLKQIWNKLLTTDTTHGTTRLPRKLFQKYCYSINVQ